MKSAQWASILHALARVLQCISVGKQNIHAVPVLKAEAVEIVDGNFDVDPAELGLVFHRIILRCLFEE